MAEALAPTIASDKKADETKSKIFGKQKDADVVIYRLVKENDRTIRMDTPRFPPYKRFPNTDIIVWEGGTREIRWLPGEQSIFVDEQEKNGRKIPDNILHNPNNRFEIIEGDVTVRPHQKTKIQYLDICNRNVESKHRTGTVEGLFAKYTEVKRVADLRAKQDKQKEAMEKAFAAKDEVIMAHALALNIPLIDNLTQASREYGAIVADYRQIAMDNPDAFLKVFNQ